MWISVFVMIFYVTSHFDHKIFFFFADRHSTHFERLPSCKRQQQAQKERAHFCLQIEGVQVCKQTAALKHFSFVNLNRVFSMPSET